MKTATCAAPAALPLPPAAPHGAPAIDLNLVTKADLFSVSLAPKEGLIYSVSVDASAIFPEIF